MAKFITLAECKKIIRVAAMRHGIDTDRLNEIKSLVTNGKLKDITLLVKCMEMVITLLDSELFTDTHNVYTIRVNERTNEKLDEYRQIFRIGPEALIERALSIYLTSTCPCCGQKTK